MKGCYFGSSNVGKDVPTLVDRYLGGDLLMDDLISSRIGLEDLDNVFARLRAGDGARIVLVFD